MGFDLIARAPYGCSLLVALYTTEPHNFYRTAHELAKVPETFSPGFASPAAISVRSFRAEPKRQAWAGGLVTQVCPTNGCTP